MYWPDDRKTPLAAGRTEVTLQGQRSCGGGSSCTGAATTRSSDASGPRWTERTLTVRAADVSRVAIHLQLESGGAEQQQQQQLTTEAAVDMAERVLELHRQQRSLAHPVLVSSVKDLVQYLVVLN